MKDLETAFPRHSIDQHVYVLLRRLRDASQDRRVADRHNLDLMAAKRLPPRQIGLAVFPNSKTFCGRAVFDLLSDIAGCQASHLLKIIDDGVVGELPERCNIHDLRAKYDVGRTDYVFIYRIGNLMPELLQPPADRFDDLLVTIEAMHSRMGYAVDQVVGAHCSVLPMYLLGGCYKFSVQTQMLY